MMSRPMRDGSKAEVDIGRGEMPHAVIARSRSRNDVLHALIPRMLTLLRRQLGPADFANRNFDLDVVEMGDLTLESAWTKEGFYLRVSQGHRLLFTAYLWPRSGGKYFGGSLHVMTWQRGERERRIIEPTPPIRMANEGSLSITPSEAKLVALNSKEH